MSYEHLHFWQREQVSDRITRSKQTTDGVEYGGGTDPTKWMTYAYNLSGALIEQQYPSGRVVRNTLDQTGDLQQVQSKRANDTFKNYANGFTYTAAGAVAAMRLGNGRWESTQFNSRLQPTQIGLGSSATSQDLLKLNYDYGSTNNNGNVLSQLITVPTIGANQGFTATQTYTYDSLNRIKDAVEVTGTETWRQTFLYDRYGNRTFDTTANRTTTIPAGCSTAVCNPSVDPATNKLVGYQFDNAGNTKVDANGQTFIYDSENKQVQVDNASGIVGQYVYNGDGQRIKKVVPGTGETTIFVYDASNKLVAEYSTIVEPSATTKISYLTNDHLGSPRITTDAVGQVISRRDFRPFGEEISRTNYGSDSVRQKFTGYERDGETNLDFAQTRMYAHSLGRFSTPDPLAGSGKSISPQTWNRYTYALNNPLRYEDTDGLKATPVFRDFKDLSEDEKRILNASTVTVKTKVDGKTVEKPLSGKELYDALAAKDNKDGNKLLAGFLNQTAVLASQTFSNGKTAISYIESVTTIQQDRIYANVADGFKEEVEKLSDPALAGGRRYVGPENSSAEHGDYDTSFRQNFDKAPQQLSFSSGTKFRTADIDIDYCLKGSACHAGEVIGNKILGRQTDPYKVYKLLGERPKDAVKPNYAIKE